MTATTRLCTGPHLPNLRGSGRRTGLSQHKLSTRSVAKSVIKCWLVPFFGNLPMRDICGQHVQMFVRNCHRSPRSCLSYILILRMMWRQREGWRYCSGDPFEALILPERERKPQKFFTLPEITRILLRARKGARIPLDRCCSRFNCWRRRTGQPGGRSADPAEAHDAQPENCHTQPDRNVWLGAYSRNQEGIPRNAAGECEYYSLVSRRSGSDEEEKALGGLVQKAMKFPEPVTLSAMNSIPSYWTLTWV